MIESIKLHRTKGNNKNPCTYQRTVSGTELSVYLDLDSCLCQDSWIQIEMVDLGCGIGPGTVPGSKSMSLNQRMVSQVSDGNLSSCAAIQSIR